MSWRIGWPPWESEQVKADRRRAMEEVERATIDLSVARQKAKRTARVANALEEAKARNHFSESMEALFDSARVRKG
jgi:hypothetical protein